MRGGGVEGAGGGVLLLLLCAAASFPACRGTCPSCKPYFPSLGGDARTFCWLKYPAAPCRRCPLGLLASWCGTSRLCCSQSYNSTQLTPLPLAPPLLFRKPTCPALPLVVALQLLARFIAQHGLVVVPNKEAAEFAALEVEAAAAAAAAAEAELGGAGKPAKRAAGSTFEGCCPASCPGTPDGGDSPRRLGLLEQRRQTAARLAERRAALDDRWGGLWEVASEEQVPCWPRGVRLPLMAVACWHAVDALL